MGSSGARLSFLSATLEIAPQRWFQTCAATADDAVGSLSQIAIDRLATNNPDQGRKRNMASKGWAAFRHRDFRLFCRSEEHTSELQSRQYLVCRLLLEKKKGMLPAWIGCPD